MKLLGVIQQYQRKILVSTNLFSYAKDQTEMIGVTNRPLIQEENYAEIRDPAFNISFQGSKRDEVDVKYEKLLKKRSL